MSLIGFLLLLFLLQWGAYTFTASSVSDWYLTLRKPQWTPPSGVFGPVWTILYVMIALSGWCIFIKDTASGKKNAALTIYGLQLLSNFLWSYFFFFLQSPGLALLDIFVLVGLIAITIWWFAKIDRFAALLLIPYFLWTLYATALNAAIWSLNR